MERPVIYGVVEETVVDGMLVPVAVIKIDPLVNLVTYKRMFPRMDGEVFIFEAVMN